MRFRVKMCFILVLCVFVIGIVVFPLNSNALTIQKICGYIEPDITYLNSEAKSGFKIQIVGTTASAISDENGYFQINGFQSTPDLKYSLEITKVGYLKREIKDIQINSSIFVGGAQSILMWAGDMPVKGLQDDSINMSDIIQIAKSFNAVKTDANYNASCDFDMDGSINIKDVIAISKHFNSTSDNYENIEISIIEEDLKAPEGLNSLWYTGTTVVLNWNASGSNISGYEVYCNEKVVGTTSNTNFVYYEMTPNSINVFYIKAFDSEGKKSLPSNSITVTALADDHGNTMGRATPIESGREILGAFQGVGDLDYFKFVPEKSGIYVFRTIRGYLVSSKIVDSNGIEVGYINDYEYNLNAGYEYFIINSSALSNGEYRFLIRPKSIKPDLAIEDVQIASVLVGNPAAINVKIKNVGDVSSKGSFRVVVDIDDQKNVLWADCTADIVVGESNSIQVNNGLNGITDWIPEKSGSHKIIINIDTNNQIDEIIENNNSYACNKYIDDYPDTFETALGIEMGKEVKGAVSNATDKDYFYIVPKATGVYQIELPKSKYTNVYLYNSNKSQIEKTVISYDSRNNRLKCYVKAMLNANEKYYIAVKPADVQNYTFEEYTLSMFEVQ
ncbi:MAG TPA: CARDB domain-containing protein [Pseudobacteroides sp.]|uniref:CARDB domain-containing protein n=1 Tax=Pseudobacteroides sp. TaxID=1968840 RepID=UPI002F95EE4D